MEQLNETPLQGIVGTDSGELFYLLQKIGRASCRERV